MNRKGASSAEHSHVPSAPVAILVVLSQEEIISDADSPNLLSTGGVVDVHAGGTLHLLSFVGLMEQIVSTPSH